MSDRGKGSGRSRRARPAPAAHDQGAGAGRDEASTDDEELDELEELELLDDEPAEDAGVDEDDGRDDDGADLELDEDDEPHEVDLDEGDLSEFELEPDADSAPTGPRGTPADSNGGTAHPDELLRLKRLLFGRETQRLDYVEKALATGRITPADVSAVLPEAVRHTVARDDRLGKALSPTLESAIESSVTKNPKKLADAIFPILGPAIRKSIAAAMTGIVDNFNAALENSLSIRSLKWRWEARRTGRTFAEVVLAHTLVYRVEQVLLIHREQGVLLCHVVAPSVQIRDPDLVSAMLTAISDFVSDSFGVEDGEPVQEVKFGGRTLHVAAGPYAVLAAVVAGKAQPTLSESLQLTVEQVHLEAARELSGFDGETDVFKPVKPLLEECLDEQRKERKRSPLVWLVWLALLGAAGWFGWQAWQARQQAEAVWQGGMNALRAEPGVIVVQVDRDSEPVRIAGLRDEHAPQPAEILSAAGVDPAGLRLDFEPYQSIKASIVEQRVDAWREMVDSIAGKQDFAHHEFKDGVIHVTGRASHDWIVTARTQAPSVAGVDRLDTTDLEDLDRTLLASAEGRLNQLELHFGLGTDVLDKLPVEKSEVTLTLARLDEQAGAAGVFARVLIFGRAVDEPDPDGDLGARRAAVVRERLESLYPEPRHYVLVARRDPGDSARWGGSADEKVRLDVELPPASRR